ncbi:MAG: YcaO-like family protein, partial [Thermodesulfobacteriota bacterium]
MSPRTISLQDAFKGYTHDLDKLLDPRETIVWVKNRIHALNLHILENTIRIDNGRLDIPVYFSICGHDAISVIGTKKQMGKGATPFQAEASALMELAERFSFFSFKKNPKNFTVDTYRNLSKNALPFERIAQSVHDDPDDRVVSLKLFEDLPLNWTEGLNLTTGADCLIPFDWFYAINEFNGPSSGNCLEEAVCQGICEVVERHVSARVCRHSLTVPGISLESVVDPNVIGLIDKYRQAGIRLFVSDFSLGIGIPTVGVLAYDPSTFPGKSEIVWTAGTTTSPQKSLNRALTEVAQLAGDFNTSANYVASGLPKLNRIEDAGYITHPAGVSAITDLPDISDSNFRVEISRCVDSLVRKNMEVLIINTTHPSLQIPCCYTIIPGAHFRERAVGTGVAMFCAKLILQNTGGKQAIRELCRMEQLLPDKYFIPFYLASAHLSMGNTEVALDYLKKSVRLGPQPEDMASIFSLMGTGLKDQGKYREAIAVMTQGLDYDRE